MNPENELIRGIEEETEEEIRRIEEDLARLERDRQAAVEREIEAVRKEIAERTEAQLARIEKSSKAVVATEVHKISLEARERFFKQLLEAARGRIRELVGRDGYAAILKDWIVEAAVGLAADEAVVSASPAEMELCRRVLAEAEREIGTLIGRGIKLRLDESALPGGQGVLLTASNRRTAYNNQVHTRMMRRQTEIRRIIYEELSRVRGADRFVNNHVEQAKDE